ncbi:MAG: 16S rRNA (guanine(527)-N(7))-methyltransferase RsmG [Oscillospiraceae bacterium]|nr:16S rRNA (guanine(527)-N(7))-methyltransferase RsmG [Oscillospiraceae bacterium]RKJ54497.1 16S rRNA (guanine(527)-N(7))-methyltransferase RsmG [bacterium 1XD42-8]RKJ63931.1 16S rRNA (guanine(527)-N(7))-methyltransferase RsmG [bacterium 1XD42-1]
MIDEAQLKQECQEIGLEISQEQQALFCKYAEMLLEWNEKMNLTAIKKSEEIVTKHFVDSLTLLTAADFPQEVHMLDVGTGAGFPSVPIKIVRPDIHLTLLDSLNKRITFLTALSRALGQENSCIHARAEEAGRKPEHREQYGIVTARAVAHLQTLSEYCLPFVKQGGIFAAMKGGEIQEELEESQKAVALLGGKVEKVLQFQLPDQSSRSIILIKKISQTSSKYPRPSGKIIKSPLM